MLSHDSLLTASLDLVVQVQEDIHVARFALKRIL